MLGKPRILTLFPNSFNKVNIHDRLCKILYIKSFLAGIFDLVYLRFDILEPFREVGAKYPLKLVS